jgi:hypothetical protein
MMLLSQVRGAVLLTAVALEIAVVVPALRGSADGFLYGDSNFYAAAAESVYRDGDLDLLNQCFPDAASVEEVLPRLEGPPAGDYGWSAAGTLTIKQSPVFGLAALPFYVVFGEPGFLVANLVLLNLLIVAVAELGGGTRAAWVVALLMLVTTPLIRFAYNFSPDLFLTLLIVGALLAARSGRGVAAGLCAGLAVSAKLYVVVLLLPVPALLLWQSPRFVTGLKCVAAGVVGLLPGLVCNAVQFGAPWVTGYERELRVTGGVVSLADHSSRFTEPPLEGLRDLFTNPAVGLLWDAPLILLVPVAVGVIARSRPPGKPALVAALAVGMLTLALFAPYRGRDSGSTTGNRYMFPALACGYAVLAAAAGRAAGARDDASARPAGRAASPVAGA